MSEFSKTSVGMQIDEASMRALVSILRTLRKKKMAL